MAEHYRNKPLRRLGCIWADAPLYFITVNTHQRQTLLADDYAVSILQEVWQNAEALYGWRVGAYVVMPDHVHFFCGATSSAQPLSTYVGKWKEWTAKYLHRRHGYPAGLWQERFFDHLLRSEESYAEKWLYVFENPVRAGLVAKSGDWPYSGTIHHL